MAERQRYAAWKAADIRKALREGRPPQAGPPVTEDNTLLPLPSAGAAHDTTLMLIMLCHCTSALQTTRVCHKAACHVCMCKHACLCTWLYVSVDEAVSSWQRPQPGRPHKVLPRALQTCPPSWTRCLTLRTHVQHRSPLHPRPLQHRGNLTHPSILMRQPSHLLGQAPSPTAFGQGIRCCIAAVLLHLSEAPLQRCSRRQVSVAPLCATFCECLPCATMQRWHVATARQGRC